MINWLKNINKESPDFWKNYISKFEQKPNRYVIISLSSTGLDTKKDLITAIGAIGITNNAIVVADVFEALIDNGEDSVEIENPIEIAVAIEKLIAFIGNSILVGHRIDFDIDMINSALNNLHCGKLKNEALDIEVMYRKLHDITNKPFTVDKLLSIHKIDKGDRNSVVEEAFSMGILYLKLKSKFELD